MKKSFFRLRSRQALWAQVASNWGIFLEVLTGKAVNRAKDLFNRAQYAEAQEEFLKVLPVYSLSVDTPFSRLNRLLNWAMKRVQALIWDRLGQIESRWGNYQQALGYHHQALTLAQETGDEKIIELPLVSLGVTYWRLGDSQKGLEYCHQALALNYRTKNKCRNRGRITTSLGCIYMSIGQYEKAREYCLEALQECRKARDYLGEEMCLNNLGTLCFDAEDLEGAKQYFLEALKLSRKTGSRLHEIFALGNLGVLHYHKGDMLTAEGLLKDCLEISQRIGNRPNEFMAIGNLGQVYKGMGEYQRAQECFSHALKISQEIEDREGEECWSLHLGRLADYYLDDPEGAYEFYRHSIELLEERRGKLKNEPYKASFLEANTFPYEAMVLLCLKLNRTTSAFLYAEQAKARALIDLMAQRFDDGYHPSVLAERFPDLQVLNSRLAQLKRSLSNLYTLEDGWDNNGGKEQFGETWRSRRRRVREEIEGLEQEYSRVYAEIEAHDPELASFICVNPPSIPEIQALLDRETVVVEYFQTNEKLIIFVIPYQGDLLAFKIPMDLGQELDKAYKLITSLGGSELMDIRSHGFIRSIQRPLQEFWDLFISPIWPSLQEAKRLLIVPHLFWHYLPFHALYDHSSGQYLIDQFEICYLPSASVLHYCRKKNSTQRDLALILGNPRDNLTHITQEIEELAFYLSPQVDIFLGKETSLAQLKARGDKYDVIYLACHGRFREDNPFLSYLDLPLDKNGEGICLLPDIFGLRLRANLVTISACESGLGRISAADELIGFSRAFFYAGTPSLLVTLWKVADISTAEFMGHFYRHLIQNKTTKSRALQLAIQALKQQESYKHPYFWAPFVLLGDWY